MGSSPPWYPAAKRGVDLVAALVAAVPGGALWALLALIGRAVQGPPVHVGQERVGRGGVPFTVRKLRTMRGPVAAGRAYAERDRLTAYGRVLRRLKLDELPQLLALLTGRMSLVGPRPLLAAHVALVGGGGRRHEVRPGLTCLAQLELAEYGYLDRHRQVALDEEYVACRGPRLDTAILARTVVVLLGLGGPPRTLSRQHPTGAGRPPRGALPGADPDTSLGGRVDSSEDGVNSREHVSSQ